MASHKFDVKPRTSSPFYDIVEANDQGIAQHLPHEQEQQIRDDINSYSPDQYPTGGLVLIPQNQWTKMQEEMETRGTLWGQPVSNSVGSEERFGGINRRGASRLGDGFTVPGIHRTYINAGSMKNPKHFQEILAHELGHHAAEWDDPSHPDPTEASADQYKNAYLKRGLPTQKMWSDVNALPVATQPAPVGLGGIMAQAQAPAATSAAAGLGGILPKQANVPK